MCSLESQTPSKLPPTSFLPKTYSPTERCVLTASLPICSVIVPLMKGEFSLRSQELQNRYCVKTKTCGHHQGNYNDPHRVRQPTKGQYPDSRYKYRYLHFTHTYIFAKSPYVFLHAIFFKQRYGIILKIPIRRSLWFT